MAILKKSLLVILPIVALGLMLRGLLSEDARRLGSLTNPGPLSQAHQFLQNDCAACHTPHKGVQDSSCIVCHANAKSILQRQPTAFHADIGNCAECHKEHLHPPTNMTQMDHELLAKIGLKHLEAAEPNSESKVTEAIIKQWLSRDHPVTASPHVTPMENTLNCATCHSNDDRHFDLFGQNCASCHSTQKWSIPRFQHPSSKSQNCAQCHQAPPSHYMKHFNMISAKVAGKPHAKVNQCYSCHQTTSWTDILGKGKYKHH